MWIWCRVGEDSDCFVLEVVLDSNLGGGLRAVLEEVLVS